MFYPMPDEILYAGPFRIDPVTRLARGPRGEVELTPLELRFLLKLLERRGAPVSTEELLREVWGYHPSVQSKAVMLLVSRLRRKLGEDAARPRLILTAPGGGYFAPLEGDRAALVERVERLHRTLHQDLDALRGLDALIGEIKATLEQDLPLEDRAQLTLALGAWALERQPHRSAVPLWELAGADLPPHLRVSCAIMAAKLMSASGLRGRAAEALTPWLDRCPTDLAGQRLRAEVLLTLANQHRHIGESSVAEARAQEALSLAERMGDPVMRGRAMGVLGMIVDPRATSGTRSQTYSADAVSILRSVGAELIAATFECNLGVRLFSAGQLDAAEAMLTRGSAVQRRAGRDLDATMADVNLGVVRLAQRDPQGALALAEQALATFQGMADHIGECYTRLLQGRCLCVLDALDPAGDVLDRCLALAERHRFPRIYGHALRYRAWVAAMRGEDAARTLGAESQEVLGQLDEGANPFLALWLSWISPGAPPEALDWTRDEPGVGWADGALTRALAARLGRFRD